MITRLQPVVIARVLGASLLATAALAIAGTASAQADDPSIHVSYADLNLHSQQGARAILGRIEDAADQVCGGQPDMRQLTERALYQACRRQAVEHAVRDLDAPVVTAMAGMKNTTVVLAGR
jgi:UrcA family protein